MALNPIVFTEKVVRSFLRYQLTAYPFADEWLHAQMRRLLSLDETRQSPLLKAPHHTEDESICIYLDGLSGYLHGNAATAEQDQRIRTWLRNNGYEVIEISGNELDDEDAMLRHFRKLAGYLSNHDLRDRLRSDRSWFRKAADAKATRERFALQFVHPKPEER